MPGPVTISQMTTFVGTLSGTELFPMVATSNGVLTNFNVALSNIISAVSSSPFGSQAANVVYAGPASGPSALPTFRSLVIADIPWTGLTQDISNTSNGTVTVIGLQTRPLSSAAPLSGQVLEWNGSIWAPTNATGTLTGVTGDVTISSNGTATVIGLQTRGISSASPGTNQVLAWNGSLWTPTNPFTSPPLSQDVTATVNGTATVVGLQTRQLLSTAPTTAQILGWNGAAWLPETLAGDINISTTNATTVTVVGLQGRGVLSTAPSTNQTLMWNGSNWAPQSDTRDISFIADGGGTALITGVKGYLNIDFGSTIKQVTLLADQTGSVTVDIWKCTYSQFDAGATHPVVADSITASDTPVLAGTTKYLDSALTGWTTAINAGDVLAYDIKVAATNITRVTVTLKVTIP